MNRLAETRKAKGLTQEQLAALTGISRPYISRIESGKQIVYSNRTMESLAKALGEPIEHIFFK